MFIKSASSGTAATTRNDVPVGAVITVVVPPGHETRPGSDVDHVHAFGRSCLEPLHAHRLGAFASGLGVPGNDVDLTHQITPTCSPAPDAMTIRSESASGRAPRRS